MKMENGRNAQIHRGTGGRTECTRDDIGDSLFQ